MPIRVQRTRAKGYKTPPSTKYCGRPTMFGNPFTPIEGVRTKSDCVDLFRRWLNGEFGHQDVGHRHRILANLRVLKNYDHLSCWCRLDQPCHVDVLLELISTSF